MMAWNQILLRLRIAASWSLGLAMIIAVPALADEGENFVESPGASKYTAILVGAAVNDSRRDEFGSWAVSLRDSLRKDYGYSPAHLRLLMGASPADDFNTDGPCREESIRAMFKDLAGRIKPGDQFNLVLIGHGTGSGDNAKFNIVGPDLTGPQIADLLDTINTQNIVVINTTSASHDFSRALAGNGRVIVSATRSAAEKYDTVFPRYFVEALHDKAADRDKNGRVSVLEAFNYAKARVDAYFREKGILATEHAVLDDNGDGVFSARPDARGDGRLAEIAYFNAASGPSAQLSSAAAGLRTRMSNLEREIFLLRANKSVLGESEYWAQLEPLLIELAKATREFNGVSKR